MPESPRWLIANGRNSQALQVLKRLHVGGSDHHSMAAREEFYQISQQLELEKLQGTTSLWGMFKRPSYRKRVLYGMFIQYVHLFGLPTAETISS
jgi:hypothetical protein